MAFLINAEKSGIVYAFKLYPAGATTNSDAGVTNLFGKCFQTLEAMAESETPLLVSSFYDEFSPLFFNSSRNGFMCAYFWIPKSSKTLKSESVTILTALRHILVSSGSKLIKNIFPFFFLLYLHFRSMERSLILQLTFLTERKCFWREF